MALFEGHNRATHHCTAQSHISVSRITRPSDMTHFHVRHLTDRWPGLVLQKGAISLAWDQRMFCPFSGTLQLLTVRTGHVASHRTSGMTAHGACAAAPHEAGNKRQIL